MSAFDPKRTDVVCSFDLVNQHNVSYANYENARDRTPLNIKFL